MTPWTLAPCLVTLRNQVNAIAPSRLKASDGTIGDAAHAASVSDHNPDSHGVVRAIDITQDPDDHDGDPRNDLDAGKLAAQLVASRDPRISYVIWNRRIARSYAKPGIAPWTWSAYAGDDPHTNHVHVSVVADSRANSTSPWRISATVTEEDPLSQFTQQDLEEASHAAWGAEIGRSDITAGVMLQRIYAVLANPEALADRVVAKLASTVHVDAEGEVDLTDIKEAVKEALREGVL
jgi:hypothetical protein